jgi:hypothetical protein
MGMSSHQSAKVTTTTWLTPPEIIDALGPFDLDPCCPPNMPWATAARMVSLPEDGLVVDWRGRVWLNPPFGNQAAKWMHRMVGHHDGYALLPARTETKMFADCVWDNAADGILFLRGRPHFHYPDGTRAKFNSGAPICIAAYGQRNAAILQDAGLEGRFLWLS